MLSPVVYAVPAGGSGRLPREEVLPRPDLHVGLVLAETWSLRTAVLSPRKRRLVAGGFTQCPRRARGTGVLFIKHPNAHPVGRNQVPATR